MSTMYSVDLLFSTRRADTELARMENRLRDIDRVADQAGQGSFDGMARSAAGAQTKVAALYGVATKLIGALAAAGAVRYVFAKTAELESQTASIRTLTGSLEKANTIIQQLQQYGAITPFTSTELIETAKQLAAFNVPAEKLVDTTKRLGDIAGATGARLDGLALAYGQVMAKGRLQGEELLQFTERGVALQDELQRMYGLSGEEIRKALEKGRIGAEAVEVAIINLTSESGKYYGGAVAQSETLSGKFSTLTDGIETLARTIGTQLAPMFKWATDEAIRAVTEIQRMLDLANNSAARSREAQWQNEGRQWVDKEFPGLFNQGQRAEMLQRFITQKRADYDLQNRAGGNSKAAPPPAAPPLLDPKSGRTGSGSGSGGSGRSGRSGGGGGGPDFPAYISANQMRAWLKSQGYERTSGDFTNRGHRTPNHMLNAIDIGELDGSYSFAVQRAKALERQLRATGAFGSQLFGPVSDPRGHKDHVHIPTPGGRIRVNAALAQLMGLGGTGKGGMAMQEAGWANDAERDAQRRAEEEQRRTDSLTKNLELKRAELAIDREQDPVRKLALEGERDRLRIGQAMKALRAEDVTGKNAELIKTLETLELEIQKTDELRKQQDLREGALRPLRDEIEMLEARSQGPGAVKALERRRAVEGLGKAGVDAGTAGGMLDRRDKLEQEAAAREARLAKIEQMADEVSGAVGDLFRDIISGSATAEEALAGIFQRIADSFTDMVVQMITEWAKAQIMGLFTGGAGAAAGGGGGALGGFGVAGQLVGGLFSGAGPVSFAGGGSTGHGARAGGLDGRGGFLAMLHPNETVIDHSTGGGAVNSVVNVSIASDGSAKVDASQGSSLGREVEAAVVAVLARQRRPGGILATTAR